MYNFPLLGRSERIGTSAADGVGKAKKRTTDGWETKGVWATGDDEVAVGQSEKWTRISGRWFKKTYQSVNFCSVICYSVLILCFTSLAGNIFGVIRLFLF